MSVIVIIDDRVTNRNILAKLAGSLDGPTVVRTFGDPPAALQWMAENPPDLVVTDYKMPLMDGAEFIRRFRSQPLCMDVPVIVVTVYEDREFRYRALEAGATDFLLSPLDHHEFRARARNLLTLRRQQEIIKRRTFALEHRLQLTNRLREEELRESEEKLRLVIDTVPAMISATDAAARCIFVNNYLGAFFGVCPDDAVGREVSELFGKDYGERHHELDLRVLATGETLTGLEETLIDRRGKHRVFLTTKAPLRDAAGQVANVVTVSLDIDERKCAETTLRDAKELAESASRTKTEFLANISHELRTPLTAIIGFGEIMKTELLGPIGTVKYRDYAHNILASAEHLLHIIDDMLDVSKIENRVMELQEATVDVGKVVNDVILLVRGRAEAAQVHVQSSLDKLPLLLADERRLKQILVNLISNSIKFTPPGGRVWISGTTSETGAVHIAISDTGIGMSKRDLPTAMARFGRVENAIVRKYPGTGLGLPLAVDLIELHGGSVDIESITGKGTTVTVMFPPERSVRQAYQA